MRPAREQDRSGEYAYFVSTQTSGRRSFFQRDVWASLLTEVLYHYGKTGFQLHAYVIMPEHLHVLLSPTESLEKAVQLVKGGFSFRVKKELGWVHEVWQQGFTDHRIRDEADWQHHLQYIRMNPVKAGLVEGSALYPWMGFPNRDFPQGLKPTNIAPLDVRAEARTLQAEARTLQVESHRFRIDGHPSPDSTH